MRKAIVVCKVTQFIDNENDLQLYNYCMSKCHVLQVNPYSFNAESVFHTLNNHYCIIDITNNQQVYNQLNSIVKNNYLGYPNFPNLLYKCKTKNELQDLLTLLSNVKF
jgi:hypothetical protein